MLMGFLRRGLGRGEGGSTGAHHDSGGSGRALAAVVGRGSRLVGGAGGGLEKPNVETFF